MTTVYDLAFISFVFISLVSIYGVLENQINKDDGGFKPCILISLVVWFTSVMYVYAAIVIGSIAKYLS